MLISRLERTYGKDNTDVGFDQIVREQECGDDAALAELIDSDGRWRLAHGLKIDPERYLAVVPGLRTMPISLDAAFEMSLRWMVHIGKSMEEAAKSLSDQYPDLEVVIGEAAALSQYVHTTSSINTQIRRQTRPLPSTIGPSMPDGRNRYELVSALGAGGFGDVYAAKDRQLSEEGHDALVAVKILLPADTTPWDRQRLTDEATKARRITHPNVVRVLDRGVTDQGEDFFVYELVNGGDLTSWVQNQKAPMDTRVVVSVVAKIANGVQAAHSAGVVHCDIKPGNIMLTIDGQPKVTDFGIAAHSSEPRTDRDVSQSQRLGGQAFMSPEQYRMEPGWRNIPTDIYAIGGILYFLLTGKLPNGATEKEIQQTLQGSTARTSPPQLPQVDRDLEAICRRAMPPRAEERYPSAGEFAADLESWVARKPIHWTQPSKLRITVLWIRRRPSAALATLAILVAVTVGAFMFSSHLQRQAVTAARKAQLEKFTLLLGSNVDAVEEVFVSYLLLLEITGPNYSDLPGMAAKTHMDRIDYCRAQVAALEASNFAADIETALWRLAIGMSLIVQQRSTEAVTELEPAVIAMRDKLDQDDSLVIYGEALLACARANILAKQTRSGDAMTDEAFHQLEEAASTLRRFDSSILVHREHANVRRVLLQSLAELLKPDLLDRREELNAVNDALQWWLDST